MASTTACGGQVATTRPTVEAAVISGTAEPTEPPTALHSASTGVVSATAKPYDTEAQEDPLSTDPPPPTLEVLPDKPQMTWDGPVSPDGRWRLVTVQYDDSRRWPIGGGKAGDEAGLWNYVAQLVVATDGSVTQTVRAEWFPDGVGGPFPQTLGWSGDSKAALVFTGAYGDGCGLGGATDAILRYELDSGTIRAVGKGTGHPSLVGNGQFVAFTSYKGDTNTEAELTLMDADTGEKRQRSFAMSPPENPTGRWNDGPLPQGVSLSPDERAAIVTVIYGVCGDNWREALVHVNLVTGKSTELVAAGAEPRQRRVVAWTGAEVLVEERPAWTSEMKSQPVERPVSLP